MSRMFPIQKSWRKDVKPYPTSIPWEIADLAYSIYSSLYGREQSLERLAERGGFGPEEMDEFVPDWRERCEIVTQMKYEIARLKQEIEDQKEEMRLLHWSYQNE